MVLAAEPPDISIGATIAACSVSARSASMRVIEPLTSVCRSMNSSSWWAITSTSALPMPTTWYRAGAAAPRSAAPTRSGIVRWGWHDG